MLVLSSASMLLSQTINHKVLSEILWVFHFGAFVAKCVYSDRDGTVGNSVLFDWSTHSWWWFSYLSLRARMMRLFECGWNFLHSTWFVNTKYWNHIYLMVNGKWFIKVKRNEDGWRRYIAISLDGMIYSVLNNVSFTLDFCLFIDYFLS